jgi:tRNA 2-thiouridine synthesizing protein C
MPKKFLFVLRRPPGSGLRARETLDMILTAAAFDQSVSLLLLDDGVWQIKKNQMPEVAGLFPVAPLFEALDLYDVEAVWVERESLEERGLSEADLTIPVRLLARGEVAALAGARDVVIGG